MSFVDRENFIFLVCQTTAGSSIMPLSFKEASGPILKSNTGIGRCRQ